MTEREYGGEGERSMQIKFETPFDLSDYQRARLLEAVHSRDFYTARDLVNKTRGLAAYRGGSHVAVHPGKRGVITAEARIAIITAREGKEEV